MPFKTKPPNPNLPRLVFLSSALTRARHPDVLLSLFSDFHHAAHKRQFPMLEEILPLKLHAFPSQLNVEDHLVVVCLSAEAIPAVAEINQHCPVILITNQERLKIAHTCAGGKSLLIEHPDQILTNAVSFGRLFVKLCDRERERRSRERAPITA